MERGPDYSQITQAAVYRAGGPRKLSRLLGISTPGVCYWYTRTGRVPLAHVATLARLSGIPREELRPDLFQPAE